MADVCKTSGLRFSLERYQILTFDIEPAVLPDGEWVEVALEAEERAKEA